MLAKWSSFTVYRYFYHGFQFHLEARMLTQKRENTGPWVDATLTPILPTHLSQEFFKLWGPLLHQRVNVRHGPKSGEVNMKMNHWSMTSATSKPVLNWAHQGFRRPRLENQINQPVGNNTENAHLCICNLCQQLPSFLFLNQIKYSGSVYFLRTSGWSNLPPGFGLS